jgi:hypothetical protein
MFKKIFTTKHIIFGAVVIGLIIALIQVDSCRNRDFKKQQGTIDSLTLANQEMVKIVNKQGDTIVKQNVIITQDQASLKSLTADLFDLKKRDERLLKEVQALLQIKSAVTIKNVDVPYKDTVGFKRFSDSLERACAEVTKYYRGNSVELTDTTKDGVKSKHLVIDSIQNKNFQFDADILKTRLHINSINIPDSQRIAIIVNKGGLFRKDINGKLKIFKRRELQVMVTHTNPYIQTKGMSSVVYKPKVGGRWLERLIMVGAGVAGTLYLTK